MKLRRYRSVPSAIWTIIPCTRQSTVHFDDSRWNVISRLFHSVISGYRASVDSCPRLGDVHTAVKLRASWSAVFTPVQLEASLHHQYLLWRHRLRFVLWLRRSRISVPAPVQLRDIPRGENGEFLCCLDYEHIIYLRIRGI